MAKSDHGLARQVSCGWTIILHHFESWCNIFCVSGDQAKRFFLQSGLPMQTLGRIWFVTTLCVHNLLFII